MTAAIQAVLALIQSLIPNILGSNAQLITNIINVLSSMLPYILAEVEALYAPVKNIIGALSTNPATTQDQLTQLQALDSQVDAAFDAAAGQQTDIPQPVDGTAPPPSS